MEYVVAIHCKYVPHCDLIEHDVTVYIDFSCGTTTSSWYMNLHADNYSSCHVQTRKHCGHVISGILNMGVHLLWTTLSTLSLIFIYRMQHGTCRTATEKNEAWWETHRIATEKNEAWWETHRIALRKIRPSPDTKYVLWLQSSCLLMSNAANTQNLTYIICMLV